jgi:predicted dehydrogenase
MANKLFDCSSGSNERRNMEKLQWGILGTGKIAHKFAEALAMLPDAHLAAVGSRSRETADNFGDRWQIPRRHATYEKFMQDDEVDVVYVATPHPLHRENTLGCLRTGKAVLCEKPFAMHAAEAQEMIDLAKEKKLFLMEAMWTRYFPVMRKVRSLLAEGVLGEVRSLLVDFAFHAEYDPSGRLFNRALGGGALLDLGVYPVSLASLVFNGPPREIVSLAKLGATGVDEQAAAIFGYADGRQALMTFSFLYDSTSEVHIEGVKGRLRIHTPWWHPDTITWTHGDGREEIICLPYIGNGYAHEAQEVMECLRAGRLESAEMPLEETLNIMKTMDAMRAQWGLRYAADGA